MFLAYSHPKPSHHSQYKIQSPRKPCIMWPMATSPMVFLSIFPLTHCFPAHWPGCSWGRANLLPSQSLALAVLLAQNVLSLDIHGLFHSLHSSFFSKFTSAEKPSWPLNPAIKNDTHQSLSPFPASTLFTAFTTTCWFSLFLACFPTGALGSMWVMTLLAHSPHVHSVWYTRNAQEIHYLFKGLTFNDGGEWGNEWLQYCTVTALVEPCTSCQALQTKNHLPFQQVI